MAMRHNVVLLGAGGRESQAKVRHYGAAAARLDLDVVDYPDSHTLGVISCSDFRAAEASWLAQAHGVRGADPLAATVATSKSLAYRAMRRAGFDTLWFCIPRCDDDLRTSPFKGAVIVKPDRGSGGFAEHPWAYRIFESVQAFRDALIEAEFLEAFLAYQNDPPMHHGAYLVMEYVDSPLITAAAVAGPDDVAFYEGGTADMMESDGRLSARSYVLGPSATTQGARVFVEALAQQGLTHSVIYVQCVGKEGRLYPIDFNLRPSTMSDYAVEALGLAFYEAALAYQLGLSATLDFHWPHPCVAIRRVLVPLRAGTRELDYGPDCIPLVRCLHYDEARPYDVGDAWPMFAVTGASPELCCARAAAIARRIETALASEHGQAIAATAPDAS